MKPTASASNSKRQRAPPPASHSQQTTHTTEAILLRNFGVSDTSELETVDAFLANSANYGSAPLVNGLRSLFTGMQHATNVYAEMSVEVHTLNQAIMTLKQEASDVRDQRLLDETTTAQLAEVTLLNASILWRMADVLYRNDTTRRMQTTIRR